MADPLKRLGLQTTHYSIASLLALVSGLITFPLFTRIFSVEDYGVMNLVGSTLSVFVAFGKLGIQHSIVRYQSEISANKSRFTLPQLYSTTVFGMTAGALVIMVGLVAFAQLAPAEWLADPRLRVIFSIIALLIIVQIVESALTNLLRAEQRSAILMKYQVLKKYLMLALMIAAAVLARKLTAFYSAQVVAEALAVAGLFFLCFSSEDRRPKPKEFSRPLYLELLRFGVPMMIGYELSGIVLAVGDRYVIHGMLGEAQLGLYGAAYNLCEYVQAVVIASVGQAIMPLYMEMWDREGPEATGAFISRSLRTYALFGAPVIAGLAAVGPELLPALASNRYADASAVLPWIIAGMVIGGLNSLVGAGLFIQRRTRTIMTIILSCAILNILLNVLFVPRIGIVGSALATLVCYAATAFGLGFAGRKLLTIAFPWATLARASLVAVAMYLAVSWIYPGRRLLTVGVRVLAGAPIYVVAVMLIDPDAKGIVQNVLLRFRRTRG